MERVYKENGYYMALTNDVNSKLVNEGKKRDQKYWEIIQYKNGRFFRVNNLNSYDSSFFAVITSFELFDKLRTMQVRLNVLESQLSAFEKSRRNIDTHYDAVESIMKTIKTVVDQLNGDIVLSCGDLESVNMQILTAYNRYQNLINGE